MKEEAKQKNDERTTEEKKVFFESKEQQDKEMVHKQQILERKENEMNASYKMKWWNKSNVY